MPFPIEIPADKKRRAYDDYVNRPSKPVRDILADLGVSQSTFVRLRDRWGWPDRATAIALTREEGAARPATFRDGTLPAATPRADPPEGAAPEGAAPEGAAPEGGPPAPGAEPPSSLRAAALALTAATRTHIDALMKRQRAGRIDHDEAAKALASYAKTLKAAQELLEQEHSRRDDSDHHRSGFSGGPSGAPEHSGGSGPSGGSRSIHELRDELARHLERIVAEEEARGSDGLLV